MEEYEVVINLPDGDAQAVIFPRGVGKFAETYQADAIIVSDDLIQYYHGTSKTWKILEDQTMVAPKLVRNLGSSDPSTPANQDKPPQ